MLDRPDLVPAHPDQPVDAGVRERVGLARHVDDHRANDREGERQLQVEGGPLAAGGGDPDVPADLADGVHDHVEADPAAGQLGDRRGGAEPGQEQELEQLRLGRAGGHLRGVQPALDDLGAEPVQVYPGAVVGHGDQ